MDAKGEFKLVDQSEIVPKFSSNIRREDRAIYLLIITWHVQAFEGTTHPKD